MNTGILIRSIAGAVLIVMGLLIVLVAVIALVDPVGTTHADDSDPFGSPPSRFGSSVILLLGCGALLLASLLIGSAVRRARAG